MESIRLYIGGKCSERWRKGDVHSGRIREKCDRCSNFLTVSPLFSLFSLSLSYAMHKVIISYLAYSI